MTSFNQDMHVDKMCRQKIPSIVTRRDKWQIVIQKILCQISKEYLVDKTE